LAFLSDKNDTTGRFARDILIPLGAVFKVNLQHDRRLIAAQTRGDERVLGSRRSADRFQPRRSDLLQCVSLSGKRVARLKLTIRRYFTAWREPSSGVVLPS